MLLVLQIFAPMAAVHDRIPDFRPLFAPLKGTMTGNADLRG